MAFGLVCANFAQRRSDTALRSIGTYGKDLSTHVIFRSNLRSKLILPAKIISCCTSSSAHILVAQVPAIKLPATVKNERLLFWPESHRQQSPSFNSSFHARNFHFHGLEPIEEPSTAIELQRCRDSVFLQVSNEHESTPRRQNPSSNLDASFVTVRTPHKRSDPWAYNHRLTRAWHQSAHHVRIACRETHREVGILS